jgi:hypothetical protein
MLIFRISCPEWAVSEALKCLPESTSAKHNSFLLQSLRLVQEAKALLAGTGWPYPTIWLLMVTLLSCCADRISRLCFGFNVLEVLSLSS